MRTAHAAPAPGGTASFALPAARLGPHLTDGQTEACLCTGPPGGCWTAEQLRRVDVTLQASSGVTCASVSRLSLSVSNLASKPLARGPPSGCWGCPQLRSSGSRAASGAELCITPQWLLLRSVREPSPELCAMRHPRGRDKHAGQRQRDRGGGGCPDQWFLQKRTTCAGRRAQSVLGLPLPEPAASLGCSAAVFSVLMVQIVFNLLSVFT